MFEETAEARPIVVTARVQQLDNRSVSEERRGLNCSTDCLPHVSSRTKKISWSVCGIVSLTVIITLLAVSLKKLSSVEYGLEYDRLAKELDDAAKTGGLHIGPPGFEFVKFPSTQISQSLQDTCVSQDGLRVEFTVSFQYSLPAAHIVDAVLKYRNYEKWVTVVVAAANSSVQNSCSVANSSMFQNKRSEIQETMFKQLKIKLQGSETEINDEGVYAFANSLQLENVELPFEYKNAIAEKQRAQEDIALALNQRSQELTKANTELLAAKEEIKIILARAQNERNVTITEAQNIADQTLFAFEKETEVLQRVLNDFSLDANGIIAYMANQLYANAPKLKVSIGEPARVSRKDEL